MKYVLLCIGLLTVVSGFSQEGDSKAAEKALRASNNFTYNANEDLAEDNFVDAEVNYRKAISKSGENTAAKYNMGNAYYRENNLGEAFMRYQQAGEVAQTKTEKHKAYHNLGNVFMKNEEYEKAVEAYKEALRNNPADEETRYNLALAKEMLKKQQQDQENKQDQDNQDQQQNEDENKDQQDKKDEQGDQEEKEDNEGDKKEGEDQEQDEKEGQGEQDQDQEQEQQDKKGGQPEDKEEQKKQPRPNQLSPQQIKNILEAMNNEEKKVQEKMNAKKVKGKAVKAEKDW